jgi:AcrR family transcriptional regulator
MGRPSPEESRRLEAGILEAACEMFGTLGYRAVTMRDVAARAQVSTRTLYNHHADKASLFSACLETSAHFPQLDAAPDADVAAVLKQFAKRLLRNMAADHRMRLGLLVWREGGEFPELVKASEDMQERFLIQPVAQYLRKTGFADANATELARLFVIMVMADWIRRITYGYPAASDREIARHVDLVVNLFLHGRDCGSRGQNR